MVYMAGRCNGRQVMQPPFRVVVVLRETCGAKAQNVTVSARSYTPNPSHRTTDIDTDLLRAI